MFSVSEYAATKESGEAYTKELMIEKLREAKQDGREEYINSVDEDTTVEDRIIVVSNEGYIFYLTRDYNTPYRVEYTGIEGEKPEEIEMPELTEENITFTYTPNTWTKDKVIVTISTSITAYTMQYSKTGTATDWSNYTSGIEYTENGEVYVRLTDGTNVSNVGTGNVTNIDKEVPVVGTITGTEGGGTFTGTDIGSGIVAYGYSTSGSVEPTNWTTIAATTSLGSTSITGLEGDTTYYVWVKDQVGQTGNKQFKTLGIAVTSISLDKTSISIIAGYTETLTATVLPTNATDKTVTWSSSNTVIATVNNGIVTGVKSGTATITATVGGKSATCTVKVTGETWETITFNSQANVDRVKKFLSPTGTSSAGLGYASATQFLYQYTSQESHVANPYLDGLSANSIEFVGGSFGEARDLSTGMVFSYPYFSVKLNTGRIIDFYFRANFEPGTSGIDRRGEFYGGAASNGQMVVTDTVFAPAPGGFQVGTMLTNDAYHKFNIVIENNILRIKTNDITRYSTSVPEGSLIAYWEFAGLAADYNAGSQGGRLKYITFNKVF